MRRDIFQAIADPTRRGIIALIAAQSMTPNAIAAHFDTTRQAVSKHLRILSECELIHQQQKGREIYYQLKVEKIKEIDSKIESALTKEKKFLLHGYSIHSLAADTDIPMYLLTIYINHHLKTNFSDLINQKRIAESCKLIESGKFEHLSLIGIAELSGQIVEASAQ